MNKYFSKTFLSTKITSKLFAALFLISPLLVNSQGPPPPFNDDVNDQVPIDSHIIILCVLGIILGYYYFKKNESFKKIKNTKVFEDSL